MLDLMLDGLPDDIITFFINICIIIKITIIYRRQEMNSALTIYVGHVQYSYRYISHYIVVYNTLTQPQ